MAPRTRTRSARSARRVLLARSGLTDAIDAAVAALADHGDQIITSDPDDLAVLAAAANRRIDVVPV